METNFVVHSGWRQILQLKNAAAGSRKMLRDVGIILAFSF